MASPSTPVNAPDVASNAGDAESDYYRQARREVATLVPASARRILDVGCGEGVLGRYLLERGAEQVTGIEAHPRAAEQARRHLSAVVEGDVETVPLPFAPGSFDCVILADVLEHLREPEAALARLVRLLVDEGTVVASIPNVRHYSVLDMLANGGWTYAPFGILDRTHLRFFTLREIQALFHKVGLRVETVGANLDRDYPQVKRQFEGKARIDLSFGRITLRELTPAEASDLFVWQYLVVARPHR